MKQLSAHCEVAVAHGSDITLHELEWDWEVATDEKWFVHWARTNWGSEVMLPLMRSLSPREGWLGGILKRLGLSSLKSCFLFIQADLSLLVRHLLAQFLVNRLRLFFSSNTGPCFGRPASHHFLHAALYLVLRCWSWGSWMKRFWVWSEEWKMRQLLMQMVLSETNWPPHSAQEGRYSFSNERSWKVVYSSNKQVNGSIMQSSFPVEMSGGWVNSVLRLGFTGKSDR